jgi:hypothetical protein
MGCIARLGCLMVLCLAALVGWVTRDRWMSKVPGAPAAAVATAPVWQPLSTSAGEKGKRAIEAMQAPGGPVFVNLTAAEIGSYVFKVVGKTLPSSSDSVQAAVIGDALYVSAIVPMKDLAGTGALGPLGGLLNDREKITIGGGFRVVRPGLSEFQVREIKIREFKVPSGALPRLVQQISRGNRPEGIAADALPLPTPRNLADVRIANGKVTIYKTTGAAP